MTGQPAGLDTVGTVGWPVLQKVSKSIAPQVLSDAFLGADHESGLQNANFEKNWPARRLGSFLVCPIFTCCSILWRDEWKFMKKVSFI